MKSPLLTPSIRSCPELPPELWELVAAYLSREDLWPLRSLNKAVFFIAVQVFYESLWISSYRQKGITSSTKDVCQSVIRESAFAIRVRRLHVHSDLKIGSLNRPTDRLVHLVTKALSSPHLKNVDHLSIHCDNVVLPYTVAVWNRFAKDLVTLELQFYSRSVCDALTSLDKTAKCSQLRSLIIMLGFTLSPPVFDTMTTMFLSSSLRGLNVMNSVHATQLFNKLAFLVPAELKHLEIVSEDGWGLSGIDVFNLFVTLAKAGGLIQEVRLAVEVLSLEHLLAALVLLPQLEQVSFVKVRGIDSRLRHLARGDGCTRDFKFVNLQRWGACLDLGQWRALRLDVWGNATWTGLASRRLGEGRGWDVCLQNALKKLGREPPVQWEESDKPKDVLEVFARGSVVA
ncbi:hypothetical protein DL96DRAFT_1786447 [Flagelloscypha sp. PMI_526]|nr:hypothetical protein DL96DRAFT_1786447 [Flagelloscypha sp. PMI_526]